jgi:hypothetical protein
MLRTYRFHMLSLSFLKVQTISSPYYYGLGASELLSSYSLRIVVEPLFLQAPVI